jgi:hypothetical protein
VSCQIKTRGRRNLTCRNSNVFRRNYQTTLCCAVSASRVPIHFSTADSRAEKSTV